MKTTTLKIWTFLTFTLGTISGGNAQTSPSPPQSKAEARFAKINEVWGYFMGQRVVLEVISTQHPDLAEQSQKTWKTITSGHFGNSLRSIETDIAKVRGDQWDLYRKTVLSNIKAKIGKQTYPRDEAESLLKTIAEIPQGQMPKDYLTQLFAANHAFRENPIEEMKAGLVVNYNTLKNDKSLGIKMSMSAPVSWKIGPARNPQMLWKIKSEAGFGAITSSLTFAKLPAQTEASEIKTLMTAEGAKSALPKGATILSARAATLAGKPAGMLIFEFGDPQQASLPEAQRKVFRMVMLQTVHQGILIQQNFNITARGGKAQANTLFQKYMPVFQMMSQSTKFLGKR